MHVLGIMCMFACTIHGCLYMCVYVCVYSVCLCLLYMHLSEAVVYNVG